MPSDAEYLERTSHEHKQIESPDVAKTPWHLSARPFNRRSRKGQLPALEIGRAGGLFFTPIWAINIEARTEEDLLEAAHIVSGARFWKLSDPYSIRQPS